MDIKFYEELRVLMLKYNIQNIRFSLVDSIDKHEIGITQDGQLYIIGLEIKSTKVATI